MRYSQLFGKTVKSIPSDIQAVSHRLLYQGGFIRQISAGRYAFLPLGFRVTQKIIKIIDEEMRMVGSQRVETPILHPIEIWQKTNRDQAFGDLMLMTEDHHGATFAIGATAEGLMVELVKLFKPSYRDLPIVIHQFVQKFRDEKRPRGGLLRVREFMMKDAYSFAATEEQSLEIYQKFFDSYLKIAQRLGLEVIPVLAHSGALGGHYGHEFMVLSEAGEDTVVICNHCGYAANLEKAESIFPPFVQNEQPLPLAQVKGEGIVGVTALVHHLKIPVEKTTKTLLYEVPYPNGAGPGGQAGHQLVAAVIRGDYDVNELKLADHLGVENLKLASAEMVRSITGAEPGYAGPLNLAKNIRVVWDLTTKERINFEVGANRTHYHTLNVNFGRDLPEPSQFVDIRLVKEDETCLECQKGRLTAKRAIEFGHLFKQDHFYTKPHQGFFVDQDGREKPLWMGAYGIGIGRALSTIVETHHDEGGIIWPESVAPYQAHFVNLNSKSKVQSSKLYEKLVDNGIEVLFDDREEVSAGVKFADADLIGCPYRLVVSEKTREKIEVKKRDSGKVELLGLDSLAKRLKA